MAVLRQSAGRDVLEAKKVYKSAKTLKNRSKKRCVLAKQKGT